MENKISEVCLSYRTKVKASERAQVSSSKEAFALFFEAWNKDQIEHIEEFKVLLLNRSNRALGLATTSVGGVSGTVIDVKIIMQYAIKANASAIIVAHNHPSGALNPSEADRRITRKLVDAGNVLDIAVLDHLIISPEEMFHSMSDCGEM